ncbi:MAG: ABC transporter permease [Thiotrichales bacterium]
MNQFLQKQRYLVDYTVTSMRRRWMKNLFLFSVYALLVFLLTSVMLFTAAIRQEAGKTLSAAPEIVIQKLVAGRHALIPASHLEKVRDIRGTREVRGRLWGYYFDPAVSANYTVMATDNPSLEDDEIAIGSAVARARDLHTGDYLSLRAATGEPAAFRIRDILSPESELLSADLMLMNPDSLRRFFAIPDDRYTDLVIQVRNPSEVTKVAEKIVVALPDTRPILRDEILRTYDSIFNWRQGMVFVIWSAALLSFIILAWDKASGLSADEKREIGILKAIGWSTKDVLRMKLWEGAIISLTAFSVGYLFAYFHVAINNAGLFTGVIKGWSSLYPEFELTPAVDFLQIASLLFFTVFPYTAATIAPVWKTAVTDPDAVMR